MATTVWEQQSGLSSGEEADNITSLAEQAATSATNAATSETNASASETAAAASATAAAASETAAATSETNAATSETNAATSASTASTSATTASTAATNAATSETNAATSETNAATSATSASTSATNAATSETNAATSATNAAASYDSFDDRYLGAKSSAPTLDNDGDALLTGAIYWDTTTSNLYVWDGSNWQQGAFTSGSGLANVVEDTTPQLGGNLDTNGNDILFGDNDKAIFGAGSDLQIYHDGSHSYVSDQGTGNLRLLAGNFQVNTAGNDGTYIRAGNASDVELFYGGTGGTVKLATRDTGVDITGTLTSDGLTVDGDVTITQTAGGTFLKFDVDGTIDEATIGMDATDLIISVDPTNIRASSDLVIKTDGTERVRVNSAGVDITGTLTSDGLTVDGSSEIKVTGSGSVDALKIYNTDGDQNNRQVQLYFGANDYDTAGRGLLLDAGRDGGADGIATFYAVDQGEHSDYEAIKILTDGGVTLSYLGSNKLATTSTGVNITGTITSDGLTVSGAIDEAVYNLTGTTPALDPANGTIQTHTLSGTTTYSDSLSDGESITLMIDDGTANTATFPTTTWVNNGGTAPTLATTGYTVVALWKVSTTLYGALVGDGS